MKRTLSLKALITLVLLISLIDLSLGQGNNSDVVYLKNGSVIEGVIVEIIPIGNIKIKTTDGSLVSYKMDEVNKIEKKTIEDTAVVEKERLKEIDHGYFLLVRVGPTISPLGNNAIDLSASFINGYRMNKNVSFGFGIEGVSYHFYSDTKVSASVIPVFIETRFYMSGKTRIQPMFSFQAGYSFINSVSIQRNEFNLSFVPRSDKGGICFMGVAGLRILASERVSFIAEGGFSIQSFSGYQNYNNYDVSLPPTYDRETRRSVGTLKLNVGIMINLSAAK